jgi:hypothetical protein
MWIKRCPQTTRSHNRAKQRQRCLAYEAQEATVLQLPAHPTTGAEARAQERVAYAG